MEIIVAVSQNNVIGDSITNSIPWNIPEDLNRFYMLTKGHVVIMGKNTYSSIPNGFLKNRINIVITSNPLSHCKSNPDLYFTDMSGFWTLLQSLNIDDKKKFIIGGNPIFKLFYPYCNIVHFTRILKTVEGNVMFPLTAEQLGNNKEESEVFYSKHEFTPYQFITYKLNN